MQRHYHCNCAGPLFRWIVHYIIHTILQGHFPLYSLYNCRGIRAFYDLHKIVQPLPACILWLTYNCAGPMSNVKITYKCSGAILHCITNIQLFRVIIHCTETYNCLGTYVHFMAYIKLCRANVKCKITYKCKDHFALYCFHTIVQRPLCIIYHT